ncbi:unnamed protein product [Echinostoma caproni]|uniref:Plakophilin-4 n=1 Tax=Echinostoma caproni TaxID=27848 RepID=A0A183A691_9TREM|nr:unnamed protein product [Echinostoma caproni]
MKPPHQSGVEPSIMDPSSAEHTQHTGGTASTGLVQPSRRYKDTEPGQRSVLKSTGTRTEVPGKSSAQSISSSHQPVTDSRAFVVRGGSSYPTRSRSRSGRTSDRSIGTAMKHSSAAVATEYSTRSKITDTIQKSAFHSMQATVGQPQSMPSQYSSQTTALGPHSYDPSPTESVSTTTDSREQERRQISSEDYLREYLSEVVQIA